MVSFFVFSVTDEKCLKWYTKARDSLSVPSKSSGNHQEEDTSSSPEEGTLKNLSQTRKDASQFVIKRGGAHGSGELLYVVSVRSSKE